MQMVPIKDLKDTARISRLCHEIGEPVHVTKNGCADMVIMSAEAYEAMESQTGVGRTVDLVRELKGGVSQPRNRGIFKMLNLIGVGEHAGSGVPDIYTAWDEAGYEEPVVEEQFGAEVPDRTTLTLPLVRAGLGTSMPTGEHAGEHADKRDAVLRFCSEPRTRDEIQRFLGISSRRYVQLEVLQPLLESGKLAQTIPNKPRSPNQRYVRKG
ncbi:MAG: hypothetical protein J6S63_09885 [Atopobiaceae bacterium]|nr:hypothetical protein [Atopobiaceae bacterium]